MNILDIFSVSNLLFSLIGTTVGIIFGCIPGLNGVMAIVLMLPFTYDMTPVGSFALLLGIYVGGAYGGSISAILINTPGTGGAAATLLDGYPLAQKGLASQALSASTIGSTAGGLISCVMLIVLAPQLAQIALKFGPAEYFSIALFGLSVVGGLSGDNLLKGILCGLTGLLISFIGMDPITGYMRYTFGNINLYTGIGTGGALLGLFALSEVYTKLEHIHQTKEQKKISLDENKLVSWDVLKANTGNIFRSAIIGTGVGIIPATGVGVAAWVSYTFAQKRSKHPEEFGKGSYEGVFAPETANNAVTGGALVPLLTLGIPGDVATAVLMGALLIHGLEPGAKLFTENVAVVNGIYMMLILANIFMLILGLLGAKWFAKMLKVRDDILFPVIMLMCLVGAYAAQNNVFEIMLCILFGGMGFIFRKVHLPMAPILLGLLLGPIIEANFRRAMIVSTNGMYIFLTRPISLVFIALSLLMFILPLLKARPKKGEKA